MNKDDLLKLLDLVGKDANRVRAWMPLDAPAGGAAPGRREEIMEATCEPRVAEANMLGAISFESRGGGRANE